MLPTLSMVKFSLACILLLFNLQKKIMRVTFSTTFFKFREVMCMRFLNRLCI